MSARAIAETYDESQPRPCLVDCTNLVVHQTVGESGAPHERVSDVGENAGRSLGPSDPEASVLPQARCRRGKAATQISGTIHEKNHDLEPSGAPQIKARLDIGRERAR